MGAAFAGAPDSPAQLGLGAGPPTLKAAKDEADPTNPRLRLPRSVANGLALDFVQPNDAGGTMFYGGTRNTGGLGLSSPEFVGGMVYPLSAKWFSSLETSVDAKSATSRGYGLLGQVHRSLPGGWDMSVGLRYRVSETAASPLFGSAIDGAPLPERAWALYPPAAGTSASAGYELRLNYRYGERNTLGLTYGSGNEPDYARQFPGAQPGEGRQFGLTGEQWLTPEWALNYGVMAQQQLGPHRGQGLRLGLRYRF